MNKERHRIVGVIPAYNEEETIGRVILKTQKYVDRVLVCDDGSTDLTSELAEKLGCLVVRHSNNMGKGAALKTLFREVSKLEADIIVVLDADGQHDPAEIPLLVKPIIDGEADVVVGSRYADNACNEAPFYRWIGLFLMNFLCRKMANIRVKDTQSGFRAYSRRALDVIADFESEGYGVEMEQLNMAASHNLRIVEVPVTIRYRGLNRSSKKDPVTHGSEIITSLLRLVVEKRPLRFLGIPGIALTSAGVLSGIYLLLLFNATRYFSMPLAVATLGAMSLGFLLIVASITLYAVKKVLYVLKRTAEKY